jgi:hypothetical protein
VKIRFFEKKVIFIVCFIFLFSALVFAQEKDIPKVQGKVATLNVAKQMVTVNEKVFVWDKNTLFFNENGSPVKADKLQKNIRVSIEAAWIKNKPYRIKKLYLLPPK